MPTVVNHAPYAPARVKPPASFRVTKRKPTPAELEAIVEESDYPTYELVDGELVEKTDMGARASKTCHKLHCILGDHVDENGLGHIFNSEATYKCFPGRKLTIRKPDISFVQAGRFPNEEVPEGHILFPPDLAIEVVSKHDPVNRLERKLQDYERAGVPEIWVVIQAVKKIRVYKANAPVLEFRSDEVLTSALLPGFELKVGKLFEA